MTIPWNYFYKSLQKSRKFGMRGKSEECYVCSRMSDYNIYGMHRCESDEELFGYAVAGFYHFIFAAEKIAFQTLATQGHAQLPAN
jgi:hypothetical protein